MAAYGGSNNAYGGNTVPLGGYIATIGNFPNLYTYDITYAGIYNLTVSAVVIQPPGYTGSVNIYLQDTNGIIASNIVSFGPTGPPNQLAFVTYVTGLETGDNIAVYAQINADTSSYWTVTGSYWYIYSLPSS